MSKNIFRDRGKTAEKIGFVLGLIGSASMVGTSLYMALKKSVEDKEEK